MRFGIFFSIALFFAAAVSVADDDHSNDLRIPDWAQLTGGADHLCLLDAGGVTCWGEGSDEPRHLTRFHDAYALTSSEHVQCVDDRDGTHCWRWGDKQVFDYAIPAKDAEFSVSDTNYCYRGPDGFHCPAHPWETGVDALLLPVSFLGKNGFETRAVEGGACSFAHDQYNVSPVRCWTKEYQSTEPLFHCSQKGYFAKWQSYFCTNRTEYYDGSDGGEAHYANVQCFDSKASDFATWFVWQEPVYQNTFGNEVPLAILSTGHVCALDIDYWHGPPPFAISCQTLKDNTKALEKRTAFHYPVVMAAFGPRVCAIDDGEVRCENVSTGKAQVLGKFQDTDFSAFHERQEIYANDLASKVYAEKQLVFKTLASLFQSAKDRQILFLWNAVRPVIDSLREEGLAGYPVSLGRYLAKRNREEQVKSLADFKGPEIASLADPLLVACAQALAPSDTSGKLKKLATADPKNRAAALTEARPALESLTNSDRLGGLARTALGLAAVLQGK